MINVNVSILGRRPGSVIKAGDKDFEIFKRYAEKNTTRGGCLICTMKDPAEFDRPAAVARLNELEVEFRGNMSNDNMAQLLIDSEEAALSKGGIELSRDFIVDKLNDLEVDFEENMSREGLEQLMRDSEAAVLVKGEGKFDRDLAMARVEELELEVDADISDEDLEQLLKDATEQEAEALATGEGPAGEGEGETGQEDTGDGDAPAEFDRDAAKARLKELEVGFAGNISNVNLAKLLKDTEAGLLAADEAKKEDK